MRIVKTILLAALLAGTPAAAQQAALTLSEAGQKLILDHMVERKAEMEPLIARKRTLEAQRNALLTPATYDEEKLAVTVADLKEVEGQLFDKINLSTLALLKILPEEDRAAFLTSMVKTAPKAAMGPEAAPGR